MSKSLEGWLPGTIKGQLNSEWIYVLIVSPKMPTKNLKDSQFSIQPTFSLSLAFFELHRKKNLKLFSTKSKIIDSSWKWSNHAIVNKICDQLN